MAVWDLFTGGASSRHSSQQHQASAPVSQPDTFQPQPFDPTSVQDVSSFLGGTGASAFDPSSLHPLAGLNQDTLDYLSLEDTALTDLPGGRSALPSRGWSDDLCYGTGVTYLSALGVGGLWGLQEGLARSPASAPPKLRLNAVLNSVTRRGPFLGNSAGVIAMVYNGVNSTLGYYRGKHDAVNSISAGALSGMLFKSTKGLRPMMISGGIVATAAGAWTVRYSLKTTSVLETPTDTISDSAASDLLSRVARLLTFAPIEGFTFLYKIIKRIVCAFRMALGKMGMVYNYAGFLWKDQWCGEGSMVHVGLSRVGQLTFTLLVSTDSR